MTPPVEGHETIFILLQDVAEITDLRTGETLLTIGH
jgi:hypothetical protein